jgi:molybdenum cofactor cytidylyltransferase
MIGVLLAAGFSRRFGQANKLLHVLPDGLSIGYASAKNLIDALPVSVAVIQPDNHELAGQLESVGLKVVACKIEQGMAYSLATATQYAGMFAESSEGFVIALADMPFIRPATIEMVANRLSQGNPIVLPTYLGARGHPVGFAAKFRGELEKLQGDEGARSIIKSHQDAVHVFECEDYGILMDIDTQADLRVVDSVLQCNGYQ